MIKVETQFNSLKKCMTHLDLLGVDSKIKQIVSMYLELSYQEGSKKSE